MSELAEGQSASLSRTVTDADVQAFAAVTGDTNPVHLDEEYARRTRFGGRIAHGMLAAGLISAVIGTRLPGPGSIYLGQTLRFVKPVYLDDTITATVTITAYDPARSRLTLATVCRNQRGEEVLTGEAKIMYAP